jgi:hypothetical protein
VSEGPIGRQDGGVDPPWVDYAATVIEVALPGRTMVVSPCGVEASAPGGGGPCPFPLPWWVLTASNPHPRLLTDEENLLRDQDLVAGLDAAGLEHHPAVGRSPDGTWIEVGRAIVGSDRATALAHARAFEQAAVFEVDDRLRVIACLDGRVVSACDYRIDGCD